MIRSFVINKYLSSEFLKTTLITTLVFFSLGFILNLFEEINFFKDYDVSLKVPMFLSLLFIPNLIYAGDVDYNTAGKNDSKTEIVLQYEPFGAYVPPLFKSPATKEDFLLQNASSKQHKHMNKMGLTKDQLLEERKDKQKKGKARGSCGAQSKNVSN